MAQPINVHGPNKGTLHVAPRLYADEILLSSTRPKFTPDRRLSPNWFGKGETFLIEFAEICFEHANPAHSMSATNQPLSHDDG